MPEHDDKHKENQKRQFDLVDIITSRIPMPRKKSKTDSTNKEDAAVQSRPSTVDDSVPTSSAVNTPVKQPVAETASNTPQPPEQEQKNVAAIGDVGRGWYGSWRGKAQPVAEVARESVSSTNGTPTRKTTASISPVRPSLKPAVQDATATPSPKRYLSGSVSQSAKATPIAATTNLSISSGNNVKIKTIHDSTTEATGISPAKVLDPPLPPDTQATPASSIKGSDTNQQARPVSGWFGGWWSRPDGYDNTSQDLAKQEEDALEEAKNKSLPAPTPSESPEQSKLIPTPPLDIPSNGQLAPEVGQILSKSEESRSWFWSWSRAQDPRPTVAPVGNGSGVNPKASEPAVKSVTVEELTPKDSQPSIKDGQDGKSMKRSSGWAFWSRETSNGEATLDGSIQKQVGEIAVANTPSAANPEAAQFNEVSESRNKEPPKPVKKGRGRPLKTPDASIKQTPETSPSRKDSKVDKEVRIAPLKQNLLLPEFSSTYSLLHKPSIWQNLRDHFIGSEAKHPHLHIEPTPPRIKKALAIGIHGFFPPGIFQKVLGAPTGTSIKFSNHAASAIKSWTEQHGYECEIEKVALEGEGLIADRVDTLWKLLLNWIDHVRSADFILIACHSQGVPVTIMLVEKLLRFKCIGPNTRVGICAMAGVNLGPFVEYKTQIFGRSTLELFEFSNPSSKVSKDYQTALENVLQQGVKIVYVGSIDDQLVSLESSTFSNISHPCIYRAVFIDGRLFTSDFITELVGFTFKLRNLGIPDHGLIRELSPALAGSLYTGEGHSRLYDSPDLYSLAVRHALETTKPPEDIPLVVKTYEGPPGAKDNPYFFPFAMRGILEEDKVRKELGEECSRLLGLFEEWRPVSKGLKDVRFRLEALRSKL